MDMRDIEYFSAIAAHRHIGRAAEALGLTQPALSKSVRRLEAATRSQLLERTRKGVEVTPAGSVLLARTTSLRLALNDVTREIADLSAGRTGHIRIGFGADTAEDLLPAVCAALINETP